MTFQQPRECGSFSERVLCLDKQELVSVWDQRIGKKMASDGLTQWPLFWMLGSFYFNLNNKINKFPNYCKTFDSLKYLGWFSLGPLVCWFNLLLVAPLSLFYFLVYQSYSQSLLFSVHSFDLETEYKWLVKHQN